MRTPVFRPAQPEDAAAIDAVGYAAAIDQHEGNPLLLVPPDPSSHEWSEAAFSSTADALSLVAELEGRVVGFMHAVVVRESRPMFVPHTYGRIEYVAVLPPYRSQGIGKALLAAAESWLAAKGCAAVRLSVFSSNRRAVELYAERGYAPIVVFMERRLGNVA